MAKSLENAKVMRKPIVIGDTVTMNDGRVIQIRTAAQAALYELDRRLVVAVSKC